MDRLIDLLPAVFAEDEFTNRFVSMLDQVLATVVERVDNAADYFEPALATPEFLTMLASWASLSPPPLAEPAELRRLVVEGLPLVRWRGTRWGVEGLLALTLGCEVRVSDPTSVDAHAEPRPGDGHLPVARERPPVVVSVRGWQGRWSAADVVARVADEMPVGQPYVVELDQR